MEELLPEVRLHLQEVSQLLLRRFHTDLESESIWCFFSAYRFSVVLTAVEVSIEVRHGLDPGLVSGGGKRKSCRAVTEEIRHSQIDSGFAALGPSQVISQISCEKMAILTLGDALDGIQPTGITLVTVRVRSDKEPIR